MARVKVLNAKPETFSGTFLGDDGQPVAFTTHKQDAVITVGEFKYPFEVRVKDPSGAYPVGEYDLDMDAMLVVRNKALRLDKFHRLTPVGK